MSEKEAKKDDEKEPAAEGEEAEGGEGEGGLNPPAKGLGKKKMLIIGAVAAVLLLGGGGAGLYFSGVLGPKKVEHAAEEGAAGGDHAAAAGEHGAEKAKGKDEKTTPTFFPLGDILVNLAGDGKRPNFLKIKVSLEVADEKEVPQLEALKPRIIDNFQVYLRELRIEDLRGSAGLYRLREELLLRVTEAAQPVRIRDVLFQEMLVQ